MLIKEREKTAISPWWIWSSVLRGGAAVLLPARDRYRDR